MSACSSPYQAESGAYLRDSPRVPQRPAFPEIVLGCHHASPRKQYSKPTSTDRLLHQRPFRRGASTTPPRRTHERAWKGQARDDGAHDRQRYRTELSWETDRDKRPRRQASSRVFHAPDPSGIAPPFPPRIARPRGTRRIDPSRHSPAIQPILGAPTPHGNPFSDGNSHPPLTPQFPEMITSATIAVLD